MSKTLWGRFLARFHELTGDEFRRSSKRPRTFRPHLEALGERIVPSTDYWQPNLANGMGLTQYNIGTNWSENHAPLANEDVVWDAAHDTLQMPCVIPSGLNLPTFNSLTFGNRPSTESVTVGSNLTAATVTINPRSNPPFGGGQDVILSGATLDATSTLLWTGGSVTGSGTLQVTGTGSINGTNAIDMPTLGVTLAVGDGTHICILTTSATSQPLVVKGNAAITIANNADVDLNNTPLFPGSAAVAISNGDVASHSITVTPGGYLARDNSSECVVGMGLQVQGGELDVTAKGGDKGPLHFTGSNGDGMSLIVCCGGKIKATGSLTADGGGEFYDAGTQVNVSGTLTLGVNANSGVSHLDGGVLAFSGLNGTLVAHGGFMVNGGALQSGGGLAIVQVDAGNVFTLNGGELDVTDVVGKTAFGSLIINGTFTATGGKIISNVDTSGGGFQSGKFKVVGNINLSTNLVLSSVDLNLNPGVVNHNWDLFDWTGARAGMLTWELPAGWTGSAPDDVNKDLIAHEP